LTKYSTKSQCKGGRASTEKDNGGEKGLCYSIESKRIALKAEKRRPVRLVDIVRKKKKRSQKKKRIVRKKTFLMR